MAWVYVCIVVWCWCASVCTVVWVGRVARVYVVQHGEWCTLRPQHLSAGGGAAAGGGARGGAAGALHAAVRGRAARCRPAPAPARPCRTPARPVSLIHHDHNRPYTQL